MKAVKLTEGIDCFSKQEQYMDRKEYAVELKHNGYNCAQAVLCSYAEKTGLTSEQLMKTGGKDIS